MKKIATLFLFWSLGLMAWAQAGFVIPSPTNPNDSVDIYVDIAQTTGGLKTILTNHPDYADSVYMWTWMPAGPACGNGDWGISNECMKLTHVSGSLYMKRILPVDFYNTTPLNFFQSGISFLAKLKSGYAFESDGVGEAKTEDLHIDIVPAMCSEKFCYFPEAARLNDFFSITYDNNQEGNVNLQNLGDDECYIYLYAKTGPFTFIEISPAAQVSGNPNLKMSPVPDKPGFFRFTFIPSDTFNPGEGVVIQEIKFYIIKPGFVPAPPTFTTYVPLDCE